MNVTMFSDSLVNDYGPSRVPLLLAEALASTCSVLVVAPRISEELKERFGRIGASAVDLRLRQLSANSNISYVLDWLLSPVVSSRADVYLLPGSTTINFSNAILHTSDFWYGMGPVSDAIVDLLPTFEAKYRVPAKIGLPFLNLYDQIVLQKQARGSKIVVGNSRFIRAVYERRGLRVDEVIPCPIDTRVFRPFDDPGEDYVVAYVGKETETSPLVELADAGVHLKLFGAKAKSIPVELRARKTVEILPRVSDEELAKVYSGALVTVFPFSTEPFGYVPVESMACGTPVVTYGKQGPAETVVDGVTGWLTESPSELIAKSLNLWKQGTIPKETRSACAHHATRFDFREVGRQWTELFRSRKAELGIDEPRRAESLGRSTS